MVEDEHDIDLMIDVGQALQGHEMSKVIVTLLQVLTDCAVQCNIPKEDFLAQAYESLSNLYDDIMEEENGSSAHNQRTH